ncbi:MAG: class I SAM-dependent methyltransferase, partial [Bacteroidota bacterium]|nr:class I SAM-dependent methyltransferase [Bacteroidota bacterium]
MPEKNLIQQNSPPHSAAYFGDFRDFWWNRDFLELMARRLHLENVRTVLDVGCGIGHWGRRLESVLPQEATIIGIDREEEWIRECKKHAVSETPGNGNSERFEFHVGDVNALEFPD